MARIVCRQLAPRFGDLAANQRLVVDTIAAADADVLVLPELVTSGYVFGSVAEVDACAITSSDGRFAEWSAAIRGTAVVIAGFAERGGDGRFYNSAVVLDAAGVLAVYRKAHLWDREKLFFTPGSQPPPVVATRFGRIGVLVCYDLEFPEFTRRLALDGADLIAAPMNWPRPELPAGQANPLVVIAQATARINHLAVACCDRTGSERGQDWNEGTVVVDQDGWVVGRAADDRHTAVADVDLTASRDKRTGPRNHVFDDRRVDLYGPA